jgi:signal peptidase II
VIVLVALVDQLTKLWAVSALEGQPYPTAEQFFRLTLVHNEGGAMGTNFGSSVYYLIAGLLIFAFLLYYIYVNRNFRTFAFPLAFIAGGAIGNLIDRIRLGYVIDYIDVDFFDIDLFGFQLERWWTFNIADAAISCSIAFLVIYMLFFHHPKDEEPPSRADSTL